VGDDDLLSTAIREREKDVSRNLGVWYCCDRTNTSGSYFNHSWFMEM